MSKSLNDLLVRRDPLDNLGVLLHVLPELGDHLDLLVVGLSLDLALGLEGLDNVLVFPPDLVGQTTEGTELKRDLKKTRFSSYI